MWVLTAGESANGVIIYLTPFKNKVQIGRSNADVCLVADSSISRKHCQLFFGEKEKCPNQISIEGKTGIWIVDNGSKYGSFIMGADGNWKKVVPNTPTVIEHGRILRIGILQHAFTVEYRPIYVSASKISVAAKVEMRNKLQSVGGDFTNVCDRRTSYLIVDELTLTVKALQALIHGVPIVTTPFLDSLLTAINKDKPLPGVNNYQPGLAEPALRAADVDLQPGNKRETLFKGLHFYTLSDSHRNNFKDVVEAAGGLISVLQIDKKELLLMDGAVMLESAQSVASQASAGASQLSQPINQLKDFLEGFGRRVVPDREIPFAVAFASTSRMCNATVCKKMIEEQTAKSYSQCTLLQDSTQSMRPVNPADFSVCMVENSVAESQMTPVVDGRPEFPAVRSDASSSFAPPVSRKRPGSWDVFENSLPKKQACDDSVTTSLSSSKRNLETVPEDNSIQPDRVKNIVAESQSQLSDRSGSILSRSQRSSGSRSYTPGDDKNPFGKRKAKPEGCNESIKKVKINESPRIISVDELDSSARPLKGGLNAFAEAPQPSTSKAGQEFVAPAAPISCKAPATSRPSAPLSRANGTDCKPPDWIDLTDRQVEADRTMGEALGKTIILLSLVTLAYAPNDATSLNTTSKTTGLQNVKVFSKQAFTELNQTIELEPRPDFDEGWPRLTR